MVLSHLSLRSLALDPAKPSLQSKQRKYCSSVSLLQRSSGWRLSYADRTHHLRPVLVMTHQSNAFQIEITRVLPRRRRTFLDLPVEIRNAIYYHLFPPGKAAVQLLAQQNGGSYIASSDRLG